MLDDRTRRTRIIRAALRLAELGQVDKPPSTATMYRWLRAGRFPGAVKIQAVGRGGSWRLPEEMLRKFKGEVKKND